MPILNEARALRPCMVCGLPTRSKRGICGRTNKCKNEFTKQARREAGMPPRKPKKYANLPALRQYMLHTAHTKKQAARHFNESLHCICISMAMLGLQQGWYFPDDVPEYPRAIKADSQVGLKLAQRVYRAATQKLAAGKRVTSGHLAKRFEVSREAANKAVQVLGMKYGWVDPDEGDENDETPDEVV